MQRQKLDLPDNFSFTCEIPVRITDLNYANHLGNDSMLSIIHEARLQFLARHGFDEMDAGGASIIMTDVVIIYKTQGRYGDILTVDVTAENFRAAGCDIYYRLVNKETGTEAARAKTGISFINYNGNKSVRVPKEFKEKIEKEKAAV